SVSGPTSNGAAASNSPRQSFMVRTCRRFSSNSCATMHRTFGRSPSAASYSKSQTTTFLKLLTGLLGTDEANQAGLTIAHDRAPGEGGQDHGLQRLRRPVRRGKGVGVPGKVDLVPVHTLVLPTRRLRPQGFRLFAGGAIGLVEQVIQVLCRHLAQEELVVWLGRQYQLKPLDLGTRQMQHGHVLRDKVQRVARGAFNRHGDEA